MRCVLRVHSLVVVWCSLLLVVCLLMLRARVGVVVCGSGLRLYVLLFDSYCMVLCVVFVNVCVARCFLCLFNGCRMLLSMRCVVSCALTMCCCCGSLLVVVVDWSSLTLAVLLLLRCWLLLAVRCVFVVSCLVCCSLIVCLECCLLHIACCRCVLLVGRRLLCDVLCVVCLLCLIGRCCCCFSCAVIVRCAFCVVVVV